MLFFFGHVKKLGAAFPSVFYLESSAPGNEAVAVGVHPAARALSLSWPNHDRLRVYTRGRAWINHDKQYMVKHGKANFHIS